MRFFYSLFDKLWQRCFARVHHSFRCWTALAKSSVVMGTLQDLSRSKVELLAENALLRHQLAILQRQVKRPPLTQRDRFWFLALASRVAHWAQALVIIQSDTVLRWHRAGFRLFWKHKSKPKTPQPKIPLATVELITRMARENLRWGAERIQGELLKLEIHVAKATILRYMRSPAHLGNPPRIGRPFSTIMLRTLGRVISCWSLTCGGVPSLCFSSSSRARGASSILP